MPSQLIDRDGTVQPRYDRVAVESRLSSGEFFWLDLHDPTENDFQLLRGVFRFHPLALEDSQHFGQRPKLEDYDDFAFFVFYGAAPPPDEDRLVEVHCFYSERFLVTVRKDESPTCEGLKQRYAKRPAPLEKPIALLYRLMDGFTDSFYPALEDFDERIDVVEDQIFDGPREEQLQEIVRMKRRLNRLRRVVGPQRDVVGQLFGGATLLPGTDVEAERYFRDVYDHLIRVTDLIDSYKDMLTGAMDVYLSSVSNRLNVETTRLTVLATIALPLIVISGFFGQNFGFLVRHINSAAAFLGLGIGLPLVSFAILMLYLRRRHVI
jgi:magnesium transporter